MLRVLRENAQSWMLKAILLLVAITFISWGGYSLVKGKEENYAAKVNGTVIDWAVYNDAYQNYLNQYRQVFGANFSDKMIAEMKLGEKVLDNLIETLLIRQEAKRLGLAVSDVELRDSIESIPGFQAGGQFDPRAYAAILRQNRLTPEQFEERQRENLLVLKLMNLIQVNGGKISEDEVQDTFQFENERLNLAFLKVSPDAFRSQVTSNDIEERDFFQKHQEDFRVPTAVQVQYLVFRPADSEGKVQVTADEVKRVYDQQKERLKIPKRVKAREILIKVSPDANAAAIDEKRKKAEEVLEKAKKTKDFASLAKQYSESETAPKGGDMGWVQKGSVDELIQTALFSLKPGEVSGIVKGVAGFYILKADEVVDEKERSLDEVKDQLAQILKGEKAKADASRKADDAFYALFRNRDLESFSKEKGVPLRTTGYFKEGDDIPELGRDPSFASAAFSLKPGEISPVVAIPPNFYILKLLDKKESRVPPFEEVKDAVRQKVIAAKAEEKARQVAEEILKEVRGGKTLKEVARGKGLQSDETGFFARTAGAIPKIGPTADLMNAISGLTEKNPIPENVLQTKDGFFVVAWIAQEPADPSKFASVKSSLEKRLAAQRQQEFYKSWIDQLKAKAKIDKSKDIIKS